MRYIDLFAGVGGFRLGIENVNKYGIERAYKDQDDELQITNGKHLSNSDNLQRATATCVYSNEWDKYANSVYRRHYGECDDRDIREVRENEIPEFDLLCAGFPCQAFSVAGKRKGFEDTRGTLFFEIARIAKYHQPKYMILENVKGLISHDKGKTLEIILETLQELGYFVNWEVYNSKDYGVPQNRERIIFICTHIKELTSAGQSQKMTSSERIIQDYLFQLLLNNLVEVKKLQGQDSKDSVVGSLLLKEILNSGLLKNSKHSDQLESSSPSKNSKNYSLTEVSTLSMTRLGSSEGLSTIRDGISMGMVENKSVSAKEEVWQSIDLLLKTIWEENFLGENKYTTSTAISTITGWKTYTYSQMLVAICTLTAHLRNSQKNLWNEILSNLIVIKESTKYARLNDKNQEAIVTESGATYLANNSQIDETNSSVGHLRGTSRPEVFPIGGDDKEDTQPNEGRSAEIFPTIRATHYKSGDNQPLIKQLNQPTHSNDRVYASDGISPIPNTMQGGNRQPFVSLRVQGDVDKRKVYTSDIAATLAANPTSDNTARTTDGVRIRRLTPMECERLQGFPDNWTQYGAEGETISDTQRYKMMGNAVTTNVITAIAERLVK